jgi:dienelactone hydrolase
MRYLHFTVAADGFTGHIAEPEAKAAQAVIIVMGGEKSLLPGIKIAERFADYGIAGLAVSLFGADGLPK